MTAWHEQDDFWETVPLFGPERMEMAPQEVDQIISLLGLQPGAAILDLCCGVGRHSLEFHDVRPSLFPFVHLWQIPDQRIIKDRHPLLAALAVLLQPIANQHARAGKPNHPM